MRGKSVETMEKSIEPIANSMKTREKQMKTLGKSMNTMEKSMSSANGKSPILSKVHVLLQNAPDGKAKKKYAPVFVPIPVGVWWYNLECVV